MLYSFDSDIDSVPGVSLAVDSPITSTTMLGSAAKQFLAE